MQTIEQRLQAIIDRKPDHKQSRGMTGGLQVMANAIAPDNATLKAMAAQNILAHRRNAACLRENYGKTYRGTYWLERAKLCRERMQ